MRIGVVSSTHGILRSLGTVGAVLAFHRGASATTTATAATAAAAVAAAAAAAAAVVPRRVTLKLVLDSLLNFQGIRSDEYS